MFSLSNDAPKESEVIYLPYWRFKGVRYACHLTGVEHRFMDLSALALGRPPTHIPFSLGLRSQALPLKLVASDTPGKFVRPLEFKETIMASDKRAGTTKKTREPVFKEDIGETFSLIYSPFYIKNSRLFDGILNNDTQAVVPDDFDITSLSLCHPEKETVFIPGICPSCGWDLEGHSATLVVACRNCHTLWRARGNRLAKIKYGCARPEHPDHVMVPFWKIKAPIAPIAMASYADLVRTGNLPKVVQPEWENQALFFWAPAFKIRPRTFLGLTTRLAIVQPDPPLEKKIHKNVHLPVTLASSEAVQSIKITLASLVRPLKNHLPGLADLKIRPESSTLVYLPFEPRHHDYFHQELNFTINKNILALSGNL